MTDDHAPVHTVLVADDDPRLLELIASTLVAASCRVVRAGSGLEALEAVRESPLDAAVLDVNLPDVSGYEICRALRERYGTRLPIVFVSGDRLEPLDRVAGLLIGADEYLPKPFAPEELTIRLRRLLGRSVVPTIVRGTLTGREREVLGLLAEGLDEREIARRLVISPRTVATHIERILPKLGVHSRAQAVAAAYRDDLIAS